MIRNFDKYLWKVTQKKLNEQSSFLCLLAYINIYKNNRLRMNTVAQSRFFV